MPHHWDDAAATRRRQIEDGLDLTFSKVFVPYFREKLTQLRPRRVLEVGGGTGHMALELAPLAGQYVVVEPSDGMYAVASEVLAGDVAALRKSTIEAYSDPEPFDLVISHMCLQVVGDLQLFLNACSRNLGGRGSIFFSLPHPVFYNDYKKFFDPLSFRYVQERSARVSFSITLDPREIIDSVPYHHRPVSKYVAALEAAGLCLTLFDEVYPPAEVQALYGQPWENPRYLVLGGRKTGPLCRRA